jgi:hypothetical protein
MARAVVFFTVIFIATGFLASEAWAGKKKVASPKLLQNTATGAHYKNVTIEMRKAGGDPQLSGKAVGAAGKAR